MTTRTHTRRLQEVHVEALDAARLEPLIGAARMARFEQIADAARSALAGRTVLNVNSTATGGGVAEMLQTLLAYVRGAGIDARWLVIEGTPSSSRSRSGSTTASTGRRATAASSGPPSGVTMSA